MSDDKGNIQTFLRIRPSKAASGYFLPDDLNPACIAVNLPESFKGDFINNSKLKHTFQFNGILPMSTSQDTVFQKVGLAAVKNALEGFNSTIFAYGQTGSGKTFTLTGGPEKYADRGIIPRAVNTLFNEFRTRTDVQYKAYISYLEIYNEQGYDLLDPSHESKALEDLNKVSMLEDEYGNFHLKNLTMHPAETEEDALNLLFMGDTNRAIAETPMNMASSRSHCIFSIAIEGKVAGTDKVRRSKLHLVDLAGSERIGKTNSSGSVLLEAKHINSSLFFLEMVIVALYEKATKGRTHIPYRNSMMTSVLRDSLGGNCKTIMVATINPEAAHTEESLSTCRFAQRVSLIKNKAVINEDLDPSQLIRRLKNDILALREEIAFLKGESGEDVSLSPQELEELKDKCRVYVVDRDPRSVLNIGAITLTKVKDCFAIMKNLYLEGVANGGGGGGGGEGGGGDEELMGQIQDLKGCLLQRDNEIAILVNMVKKGKTAEDVGTASRGGRRADGQSASAAEEARKKSATDSRQARGYLFGVPPPTEKTVFDDAQRSFEWFRGKSSLNEAMEENRAVLKDKINEAKLMGERANQSRSTITYLKTSIEAIRRERALQNIDSKGGEEDQEESAEEQTYRRAIEQEKAVYKDSFERLRVLKPEIEHVRKIIEKGRLNMQNQFDQWYAALHSRAGLQPSAAASDSSAGSRWVDSKSDFKDDSRSSSSRTLSASMTTLESSIASSKDAAMSDVSEDIMAFYQAKDELLRRKQH